MAAFTQGGSGFLGTLEQDFNAFIQQGQQYISNLESAAGGSPTVGTIGAQYGTWILVGVAVVAGYFLLFRK